MGGRDDASGLVYGLQEVTPWSAFQEGDFELVFDNFAGDGLTGTVDSAAPDNGVGATWQLDNLAPGRDARDRRALAAGLGRAARDGHAALRQPGGRERVVHAGPDGVLPPPQPGKTINIKLCARARSVTPRPRPRNASRSTGPVQIPVGSLIDTTKGEINLVSAADKGGGVQNAWFYSRHLQGRPDAPTRPPSSRSPGRS